MTLNWYIEQINVIILQHLIKVYSYIFGAKAGMLIFSISSDISEKIVF